MLVASQQPIRIGPSFGDDKVSIFPWVNKTAASGSNYYYLTLEYEATDRAGKTYPKGLKVIAFEDLKLEGCSNIGDLCVGDTVGVVLDISTQWSVKDNKERFNIVLKYVMLVKHGTTNESWLYRSHMEKLQAQPRVQVTSYRNNVNPTPTQSVAPTVGYNFGGMVAAPQAPPITQSQQVLPPQPVPAEYHL